MNEVGISIGRRGLFNFEQASEILPVIRRMTARSSQLVDTLIARLEALSSSQADLIFDLESEINEHIKAWHAKIRKLGGQPKGLWLVDFDAGDGYFCWKYPEPEILYWHGYTEGFSGRVPIEERYKVSAVTKPEEDNLSTRL